MPDTKKHPILLFDGVCNLCSSAVHYVIRHDKRGEIRFSSLQSAFGQSVLKKESLPLEDFKSLLYIKDGKVLQKSAAMFALFNDLGGKHIFLRPFSWLPTVLLDYAYSIIAKNRYLWFGKKESCMIPNADLKNRFIE